MGPAPFVALDGLTPAPGTGADDAAGAARAADAEACLSAARNGDAQAFVQILRAQQAAVFSIALRITGRRDEAEEIAQDAFLQLHGSLARIGSAAHLRHWLYRAVSHRSIDALRRRARRPRLVAETEGLAVAAPEADADPLLHRQLHALLLQLPDIARAVVVLRFQEDLDPTDIATVLDLPLNTVKSHLRRSLERLREQTRETGHGT